MLAFATTIAVWRRRPVRDRHRHRLVGLNLLRRIVRPHDAILGFIPGMAGMHDIEDYPDATRSRG